MDFRIITPAFEIIEDIYFYLCNLFFKSYSYFIGIIVEIIYWTPYDQICANIYSVFMYIGIYKYILSSYNSNIIILYALP